MFCDFVFMSDYEAHHTHGTFNVHRRHLFHKAKLAPALSYSKVKGTWMKQI